MVCAPRTVFLAIGLALFHGSLLAYGPTGHEIVGGIADKLIANSPAREKIYALTDGITLQRASTIADEIKAWDKNGVDNPNGFPHYADHPKIDEQLRDFWRANPPTQDSASETPSHHWFHYTDVPVLNPHKYSDGKTGRSQWDIVHMIAFCVDVLRGEVPEDNPRKITKPVAVILLAHYVGDIHQPLHVGADYFNNSGDAVDPDQNQAGTEDEGGNSIILRLSHGTPEQTANKGLKLHGFWDNDGVMGNLPSLPPTLSKEEHYQQVQRSERGIIAQLTEQQPANWRAPSDVALKNYAELWANEILPVAREAHQRLRFVYMHAAVDQGRNVMAGDARENSTADGIAYSDWVARIVRDELHKAGWRLADLLTRAVASAPMNSAAAVESPEPIIAPPDESRSKAEATIAPPSSTMEPKPPQPIAATIAPRSSYGAFPTDYREVVSAWLRSKSLDATKLDWQGGPKPATLAGDDGGQISGYLVIFTTPAAAGAKMHSVLIRNGKIVRSRGF